METVESPCRRCSRSPETFSRHCNLCGVLQGRHSGWSTELWLTRIHTAIGKACYVHLYLLVRVANRVLQVLTGSWDKTAKIWPPGTHRRSLTPLRAFRCIVTVVCYLGSGETLQSQSFVVRFRNLAAAYMGKLLTTRSNESRYAGNMRHCSIQLSNIDGGPARTC